MRLLLPQSFRRELGKIFINLKKQPAYISARYGRTVVVMKLIFFALVALIYPLLQDAIFLRGVFVDFSASGSRFYRLERKPNF